jgi:methanethiol S-methyltransferase
MTRVAVFTWLGALLFASSLAFCGYRFIVSWSSPHGPFTGPGAVWTDALLFGLFACHHSLLARERVKSLILGIISDRLLRPTYVWTASLLLILVLALWAPVGGALYNDSAGWPAIVHAIAQLAGLWLVIQAARTIDPLQLAGIRDDLADGLQTGGPYRLVRHPLYLGWILMVLGAAHMTGDRLVFGVLSSTYLLLAIPWEERSLRRLFGPEYEQYARRVPWRVIPYIY